MSKPFPKTRFAIRRMSIGSNTRQPWCVYDRERPSYVGRFATFDIALRSTLEPGDYVYPPRKLTPEELDPIGAANAEEARTVTLHINGHRIRMSEEELENAPELAGLLEIS